MIDILLIIRTIQQQKIENHIHPPHALLREIEAVYSGDNESLKTEMNRLFRQRLLNYGQTINDFYFTIYETEEI